MVKWSIISLSAREKNAHNFIKNEDRLKKERQIELTSFRKKSGSYVDTFLVFCKSLTISYIIQVSVLPLICGPWLTLAHRCGFTRIQGLQHVQSSRTGLYMDVYNMYDKYIISRMIRVQSVSKTLNEGHGFVYTPPTFQQSAITGTLQWEQKIYFVIIRKNTSYLVVIIIEQIWHGLRAQFDFYTYITSHI